MTVDGRRWTVSKFRFTLPELQCTEYPAIQIAFQQPIWVGAFLQFLKSRYCLGSQESGCRFGHSLAILGKVKSPTCFQHHLVELLKQLAEFGAVSVGHFEVQRQGKSVYSMGEQELVRA